MKPFEEKTKRPWVWEVSVFGDECTLEFVGFLGDGGFKSQTELD